MHFVVSSPGTSPVATLVEDKVMASEDHRWSEFQHPQFFTSQAEKLTTLLNVVVEEAKATTDPDACVDYLQLTEILTSLLNECQLFGISTADQLKARAQDVQSFISKIETVHEAVADWDIRTRLETRTMSSKAAASKKRPISIDLEEETMNAFKRRRETGGEQDMISDAANVGLSQVILPSIENSPTHWWNEPYYD